MPGSINGVNYSNGIILQDTNAASQAIMQQDSTYVGILNVSGNPEGVDSANKGSLAFDRAGGDLYVKKSGTGNTGWQFIQAGTPVDLHTAKFIVGNTSNGANYSTIASALAAASSGDTIFIQTGTYTENLTLKAGVNLVAFDADALTPNVVIFGKASFSSAGTVSISGVSLETNSDYFLEVTGSAASEVYLKNCYLDCTNNTGIHASSSSSSSLVSLIDCEGNLGTTGIAYFTDSSAGRLDVLYCDLRNDGGSTTANSKSAGMIVLRWSNLRNPLSYTTSDTQSSIYSCNINTAVTNATCVAVSGTGTLNIVHSELESGTASSISVGSGSSCHASAVSLNTTNTNAITGAGTAIISTINFRNTGVGINASTITPRYTRPGILLDSTGSGGTTGQVPVASTGNEWAWGSAGGGGGLTWGLTSSSITLVKNHGYIVNSGTVSLALPTTASSTIGDTIEVVLSGGTQWTITQDTGGQIQFGNVQTTVTTGTLVSNAQGDWVELVYQAGGLWVANAKQSGNINYT